jgi:hypothetical protein
MLKDHKTPAGRWRCKHMWWDEDNGPSEWEYTEGNKRQENVYVHLRPICEQTAACRAQPIGRHAPPAACMHARPVSRRTPVWLGKHGVPDCCIIQDYGKLPAQFKGSCLNAPHTSAGRRPPAGLLLLAMVMLGLRLNVVHHL